MSREAISTVNRALDDVRDATAVARVAQSALAAIGKGEGGEGARVAQSAAPSPLASYIAACASLRVQSLVHDGSPQAALPPLAVERLHVSALNALVGSHEASMLHASVLFAALSQRTSAAPHPGGASVAQRCHSVGASVRALLSGSQVPSAGAAVGLSAGYAALADLAASTLVPLPCAGCSAECGRLVLGAAALVTRAAVGPLTGASPAPLTAQLFAVLEAGLPELLVVRLAPWAAACARAAQAGGGGCGSAPGSSASALAAAAGGSKLAASVLQACSAVYTALWRAAADLDKLGAAPLDQWRAALALRVLALEWLCATAESAALSAAAATVGGDAGAASCSVLERVLTQGRWALARYASRIRGCNFSDEPCSSDAAAASGVAVDASVTGAVSSTSGQPQLHAAAPLAAAPNAPRWAATDGPLLPPSEQARPALRAFERITAAVRKAFPFPWAAAASTSAACAPTSSLWGAALLNESFVLWVRAYADLCSRAGYHAAAAKVLRGLAVYAGQCAASAAAGDVSEARLLVAEASAASAVAALASLGAAEGDAAYAAAAVAADEAALRGGCAPPEGPSVQRVISDAASAVRAAVVAAAKALAPGNARCPLAVSSAAAGRIVDLLEGAFSWWRRRPVSALGWAQVASDCTLPPALAAASARSNERSAAPSATEGSSAPRKGQVDRAVPGAPERRAPVRGSPDENASSASSFGALASGPAFVPAEIIADTVTLPAATASLASNDAVDWWMLLEQAAIALARACSGLPAEGVHAVAAAQLAPAPGDAEAASLRGATVQWGGAPASALRGAAVDPSARRMAAACARAYGIAAQARLVRVHLAASGALGPAAAAASSSGPSASSTTADDGAGGATKAKRPKAAAVSAGDASTRTTAQIPPRPAMLRRAWGLCASAGLLPSDVASSLAELALASEGDDPLRVAGSAVSSADSSASSIAASAQLMAGPDARHHLLKAVSYAACACAAATALGGSTGLSVLESVNAALHNAAVPLANAALAEALPARGAVAAQVPNAQRRGAKAPVAPSHSAPPPFSAALAAASALLLNSEVGNWEEWVASLEPLAAAVTGSTDASFSRPAGALGQADSASAAPALLVASLDSAALPSKLSLLAAVLSRCDPMAAVLGPRPAPLQDLVDGAVAKSLSAALRDSLHDIPVSVALVRAACAAPRPGNALQLAVFEAVHAPCSPHAHPGQACQLTAAAELSSVLLAFAQASAHAASRHHALHNLLEEAWRPTAGGRDARAPSCAPARVGAAVGSAIASLLTTAPFTAAPAAEASQALAAVGLLRGLGCVASRHVSPSSRHWARFFAAPFTANGSAHPSPTSAAALAAAWGAVIVGASNALSASSVALRSPLLRDVLALEAAACCSSLCAAVQRYGPPRAVPVSTDTAALDADDSASGSDGDDDARDNMSIGSSGSSECGSVFGSSAASGTVLYDAADGAPPLLMCLGCAPLQLLARESSAAAPPAPWAGDMEHAAMRAALLALGVCAGSTVTSPPCSYPDEPRRTALLASLLAWAQRQGAVGPCGALATAIAALLVPPAAPAPPQASLLSAATFLLLEPFLSGALRAAATAVSTVPAFAPAGAHEWFADVARTCASAVELKGPAAPAKPSVGPSVPISSALAAALEAVSAAHTTSVARTDALAAAATSARAPNDAAAWLYCSALVSALCHSATAGALLAHAAPGFVRLEAVGAHVAAAAAAWAKARSRRTRVHQAAGGGALARKRPTANAPSAADAPVLLPGGGWLEAAGSVACLTACGRLWGAKGEPLRAAWCLQHASDDVAAMGLGGASVLRFACASVPLYVRLRCDAALASAACGDMARVDALLTAAQGGASECTPAVQLAFAVAYASATAGLTRQALLDGCLAAAPANLCAAEAAAGGQAAPASAVRVSCAQRRTAQLKAAVGALQAAISASAKAATPEAQLSATLALARCLRLASASGRPGVTAAAGALPPPPPVAALVALAAAPAAGARPALAAAALYEAAACAAASSDAAATLQHASAAMRALLKHPECADDASLLSDAVRLAAWAAAVSKSPVGSTSTTLARLLPYTCGVAAQHRALHVLRGRLSLQPESSGAPPAPLPPSAFGETLAATLALSGVPSSAACACSRSPGSTACCPRCLPSRLATASDGCAAIASLLDAAGGTPASLPLPWLCASLVLEPLSCDLLVAVDAAPAAPLARGSASSASAPTLACARVGQDAWAAALLEFHAVIASSIASVATSAEAAAEAAATDAAGGSSGASAVDAGLAPVPSAVFAGEPEDDSEGASAAPAAGNKRKVASAAAGVRKVAAGGISERSATASSAAAKAAWWAERSTLDDRLRSLLTGTLRDAWLLSSPSVAALLAPLAPSVSRPDAPVQHLPKIVLVLSDEVQALPWEAALGAPLSRLPSSTFAASGAVALNAARAPPVSECALSGAPPLPARGRSASSALPPRGATPRAWLSLWASTVRSGKALLPKDDAASDAPGPLSWVVNPSGDLGRTAGLLAPLLAAARAAHDANSAQDAGGMPLMHSGSPPPSTSAVLAALAVSETYVFAGHGAGESFCPREAVARCLPRGGAGCAPALLMGCSSGRLSRPLRIPPSGGAGGLAAAHGHISAALDGAALAFLLAGAPRLVACLWDVTDRDLDRLTAALIAELAARHAGVVSTQELAEVLPAARAVCKARHLVGAAAVVYGLPPV